MKGLTVGHNGFSLTELLVVIAITGLILAILLPVFTRIHNQAQRVTCLSNLRQCGVAFITYAQSYNGRFPHEDDDNNSGYSYCWFSRIDEFFGSVERDLKQCPAWSGYEPEADCEKVFHSYKMNSKLCDGTEPKNNQYFPKLSTLRYHVQDGYPARLKGMVNHRSIVLLIDGAANETHGPHHKTYLGRIANRHSGGPNILYCDGSARYYDAESIASGQVGWEKEAEGIFWGPSGGPGEE